MKMLNRMLKYSCLILLSGLLLAACNKLDDINHNPTKPTTSDPAFLLTGAEKSAMDILYSTLQNGYFAMHYAQYWSGNSRVADSQYAIDEGNNAAFWTALYKSLYNLEQIIQLNNEAGTNPAAVNQNAIATILKAWLFQVLTDTYVNVPYTDALKLSTNIAPKYDDAKTIYSSLADTLQAQINVLDESKPTFGAGDVIYGGDVASWKILAHSLLLRLAIRMADADPAKAKGLIEANYQAAMTSNANNAQVIYPGVTPNRFPMDETERSIIDFFVSTTLVDYMKSVNDPRLPVYARPTKNNPANFVGLRYGTTANDPSRTSLTADDLSFPGTKIYSSAMPAILMAYPEVEFILAEAAARGYTVGDAATHYTNGIKASMDFWSITTGVDEYIAGVPYNAADWKNVIGTQKWLALYPQGFQAWFERIRLDFKKPGGDSLFLAPYNGSLDPNAPFVPYRITYPTGEQTQNKASYDDAAAAIGGDTKGTKNWWLKF
ncbi:SusD/RagB family nutrient-binding outer membrane lipoprotein [Chitinophaga oryziterrae]|uniref:SusD/RagB family nutrient-binding outer membrane lipoprotein n=2 Tax=Chitinophaga oryziterrae TaxID=1031224 RepID=A0A6N8JF79_9BACT|nr:SusD/RagB family nutrient-binding outer membrane lipoprotein [Chitinophaga oryziterrae]